MDLDNGQVVQLYEKMLLIRRFEEQSGRLYMQGKIHGFLHLYIGEEAIAVGAISPLRDDDYIITHYRDHGHALARGLDPKRIMAELMGKATGTSGGKGGSMHLFDVSKGFCRSKSNIDCTGRPTARNCPAADADCSSFRCQTGLSRSRVPANRCAPPICGRQDEYELAAHAGLRFDPDPPTEMLDDLQREKVQYARRVMQDIEAAPVVPK